MSEIHNPHDKIARKSLNNIEVVKDLLITHVPKEILAKFDVNKIETTNRNYIDSKLKEKNSDIVYKTKMLDGSTGYLYLLIEHQSSASPDMPFRILQYQMAIIEDHLNQNPNEKMLPIVFPMIFYAGTKQPYPYTLNLFDLFYDCNFAKQTLMQPAYLIDVSQIPDEQIKNHTIIGLLELAQKHIRDKDFALVANDLAEIIANIYNKFSSSKNLELYVKSTLYYIINIGNIENSEQFIESLNKVPVGREVMNSLVKKWFKEGEARGEARGEIIGEAKVKKQIARIMLIKKTDINFIHEVTGLSKEEISDLINLD